MEISSKVTTLFGCSGCLLPFAAVVIFLLNVSKMGMQALIPAGAVAGVGVVLFLISMKMEGRRKRKQREKLFSYEKAGTDFTKLPSEASSDLLSRIAIDFRERRLYLWTAHDKFGQPLTEPTYKMEYRLHEYPFEDVEAAALIENWNADAITAAYSTSPIKKFIQSDITENPKIGIRKDNHGRLQLLALIVQTDDKVIPFHQVNFYYETAVSIAKDSADYKEVRGRIQKWLNYMNELLEETHPGQIIQLTGEEAEEYGMYAEDGETVSEEANLDEMETEPDFVENPPPAMKQPEPPAVMQASSETDAGEQSQEPSYFEKILAENKKMMQLESQDRKEGDNA